MEIEKEKPRENLTAIMEVFAQGTATHGVRAAMDVRRNIIVRWLWRLIVLTGLAMVFTTLVHLTGKFWRPNIGTWVTVDIARKQDFPAITVCNLNHFKMSYVEKHLEVRRWVQQLYPLAEASSLVYDTDEQQQEAEKINLDDYNITDMLQEGAFTADETIHKIWWFSSEGEVQGSEYKRGSSSFESTLTNFGRCFVLNDTFEVFQESRNAGLRLVLNCNLQEYYLGLTNSLSAGFALSVHLKDETPFGTKSGFYVSPGTDNRVAIQKTEFQYDEQLSDCVPEGNKTADGPPYNRDTCIENCYARIFLKECGCIQFYERGAKREKVCRWKSEYDCLYKVNGTSDCYDECRKDCLETSFDIMLSSAKFPSNRYEGLFNGSGLLSVDIFFQSLRVNKVEQYSTYTFNDFLANIGGTMGFFLGASIVCVLEVVEAFAYTLYLLNVKCRRLGEKSKDTVQTTDSIK